MNKPSMGGKRIVGTAAAIATALTLGVGAPAVGIKSPAPPLVVQVAGDKENRQRRWKRTRAQIIRRSLRWKGVGLLSTGPRWPSAKPVQKTPINFKSGFDKTRYLQWSDGSLRQVPRRVRGKALVKLLKRIRQNPHTAAGFSKDATFYETHRRQA